MSDDDFCVVYFVNTNAGNVQLLQVNEIFPTEM